MTKKELESLFSQGYDRSGFEALYEYSNQYYIEENENLFNVPVGRKSNVVPTTTQATLQPTSGTNVRGVLIPEEKLMKMKNDESKDE